MTKHLHYTAGLLVAVLLAQAIPCRAADVKIQADIVYGHKDGLALTMDAFRPAKPNGATILFMVSGGWYSRWAPPASTQNIFNGYLDKGYTVFAVRHGSSPRYSIPEAVGDVRQAVRFVRQNSKRLKVDADRLGVLGMSAGGHLSLMLSTTGDDGKSGGPPLERVSSRVAAVVALVPPTDLRVAVWDAPESLPAYRGYPALNLPLKEAGENSPLAHVSKDDAPALVIMGGKDKLVPAKHGEWIAKAFKEKEVDHKLLILDAGHGLEGAENRATVLKEATAWFDRHLAKRD
ncbi:MAG: prolyl oligopeptidase family serine peptidase [Pirellulaceae bacterium]|nr:prolyl oligopeptidase family serine peptidase [Pirellulaceae bacterium]